MIDIIHPDTLSALGLQSIFERIMPMAETHLFASFEEMDAISNIANNVNSLFILGYFKFL